MQMLKDGIQSIKREIALVMRAACQAVRDHRILFLTLSLSMVLLALILVLMVDEPLFEYLQKIRPDLGVLQGLAKGFRKWGKGYDHLLFIGVPLVFAIILKSKPLGRLVLTAIVATLLAAIAVNIVRVGSGRPRPSARIKTQEADRLTGPSLRYAYQSFPSGHTASAFAGATALIVCSPVLGVIPVLSAICVGGSSWISASHYVADVFAGASIGILFGLAFGLGFRRRGGLGNMP